MEKRPWEMGPEGTGFTAGWGVWLCPAKPLSSSQVGCPVRLRRLTGSAGRPEVLKRQEEINSKGQTFFTSLSSQASRAPLPSPYRAALDVSGSAHSSARRGLKACVPQIHLLKPNLGGWCPEVGLREVMGSGGWSPHGEVVVLCKDSESPCRWPPNSSLRPRL